MGLPQGLCLARQAPPFKAVQYLHPKGWSNEDKPGSRGRWGPVQQPRGPVPQPQGLPSPTGTLSTKKAEWAEGGLDKRAHGEGRVLGRQPDPHRFALAGTHPFSQVHILRPVGGSPPGCAGCQAVLAPSPAHLFSLLPDSKPHLLPDHPLGPTLWWCFLGRREAS